MNSKPCRQRKRLKGEKQLYRETIGLHLFGDRNYFPGQQKFSLKPLEQDGATALVCSDIPGMDKVILKSFLQQLGGQHNKWELHSAEDIFLALAENNESIPPASDLKHAVFSIKRMFTSKKQRILTKQCVSMVFPVFVATKNTG